MGDKAAEAWLRSNPINPNIRGTFVAVRSIILGLDYQARWFWIEGVRLFRASPVLTRVAFELATYGRAFDDVVSFPIRPDRNAWGQEVGVDAYQAKFKVDDRKRITTAALADPVFINAKRHSLLQRLQEAQRTTATTGMRGRYTIVTPWQVHPDDALSALKTTNGELDLDALFVGGNRSAMGKIRQAWKEHLRIADDATLRTVLEPFRLFVRNPDEIDRTLEAVLDAARLSLVPTGALRHPYVDLAHGFVKARQREFDEPTLRGILDVEGLWLPAGDDLPGHPLAIRSFRPFAAHLEDEAEDLLDLVPLFHARSIRTDVDWNVDVAPRVARFLEGKVEPGKTYRLYLDAHNSIAFAAGWDLHHAGATVIPMQRTGATIKAWPEAGERPDGPLWRTWETPMASAGQDIAIALGVTHDVRADVEKYVSRSLPSVRRIVGLTINPRPSRESVVDGAHAHALAHDAVEYLADARADEERGGRIHVFAAAPNSLMFFLGRLARPLGPTTVYEFDFDTRAPGAYVPAITAPAAQ